MYNQLEALVQPLSLVDPKYCSLPNTSVKYSFHKEKSLEKPVLFYHAETCQPVWCFGPDGTLKSCQDLTVLPWRMEESKFTMFGAKYRIEEKTGKVLFTIKKRLKHAIYFTQLSIGTVTIEEAVNGSIMYLQSSINKIPIAKVEQTRNSLAMLLSDVPEYELTIAPNMDIAAVLAFVVIFYHKDYSTLKKQEKLSDIQIDDIGNGTSISSSTYMKNDNKTARKRRNNRNV